MFLSNGTQRDWERRVRFIHNRKEVDETTLNNAMRKMADLCVDFQSDIDGPTKLGEMTAHELDLADDETAVIPEWVWTLAAIVHGHFDMGH